MLEFPHKLVHNIWLRKVFDELKMALRIYIIHIYACFWNGLNYLYNLVFIINERKSTTGHNVRSFVWFTAFVLMSLFTIGLPLSHAHTHIHLYNIYYIYSIDLVILLYTYRFGLLCWTVNSFRCYQTTNCDELKPIWSQAGRCFDPL